ncbi:hypothetical protein RGQ15_15265 [Paracoccus sp. MBLB3053]|uniref:DUF707 domain-containing protein n=1 Tax=Paracoccus aurantius TaxID=3073814 RepID=A0ABU2HV47_9RHOB|nr:hypothetical protein [Paracoccus sp. MBLB3053]MDS9468925.1 hypothetical protein [Paracoccus sp. MBLB3053]
MAPADKRFLVVTRIGPKSLHNRWLDDPAQCQFDTVLSAYSDTAVPVDGPGIIQEQRPGRKVEGYGAFLSERKSLWSNYDYICLMDEDIDTTAEDLNRAFGLCAAHDLLLAQPALSHDSHFTYAGLLQQPAWLLRYVNFIEMMCPIFRRDALARVLPLYRQGLESGIDLVWCNLLGPGATNFAVLDAVAIRHTEPVGGNKAANGFTGERRYEDDIATALSRYGVPWLSCVPFSARTPSGRIVENRARLFISALGLLAAVPQQRPVSGRLRFVITHLRHMMTRAPRNIRVEHPPDVALLGNVENRSR